MENYICKTCGTQYAATTVPPEICRICADERQYVGWDGQEWTTLAELQAKYTSLVREEEPGLTGIGMQPAFAINQRALLIQTPQGNVLWDCTPLITGAAIQVVRELGGLSAIAISHPHYYSSMVEWSRAFDNAPVYLHAADREWVMRPDPAIQFWEGDRLDLPGGLAVYRCGGHFPGSTLLHWPQGAEGRGSLLTGDTINVVRDRRFVSFMYSFPNLVPLSPAEVERIAATVAPLAFDRIYSAWYDNTVMGDGQAAVQRSAERYLRSLRGERIPVYYP